MGMVAASAELEPLAETACGETGVFGPETEQVN